LFCSHYDEVCELPDEFSIIASNDNCAVQGFQYADQPVWGVPFHPEMGFEAGETSHKKFLQENPQLSRYYLSDTFLPGELSQNELIFRNFLLSKSSE